MSLAPHDWTCKRLAEIIRGRLWELNLSLLDPLARSSHRILGYLFIDDNIYMVFYKVYSIHKVNSDILDKRHHIKGL